MRYILVNGRKPNDSHCAFCPAEIKESYVRDLETRVVYCTHYCLEAHIFATNRALEARSVLILGSLKHAPQA